MHPSNQVPLPLNMRKSLKLPHPPQVGPCPNVLTRCPSKPLNQPSRNHYGSHQGQMRTVNPSVPATKPMRAPDRQPNTAPFRSTGIRFLKHCIHLLPYCSPRSRDLAPHLCEDCYASLPHPPACSKT